MEQLIVTPTKPYELILGKTIPYIIIALIQMIAVTIFAVFWFRIPLVGSIPLLFFATCVFLLSTLGIGLFISTISSTQQQAMMTCFFFILPFFMLSGFVFPIANMPQVVQWLTHLNPLMYFLIIIRGIRGRHRSTLASIHISNGSRNDCIYRRRKAPQEAAGLNSFHNISMRSRPVNAGCTEITHLTNRAAAEPLNAAFY